MSELPKTWHYGLMARSWAELNVGGDDIPFYQQAVETFGQPALDLACGTGRLLLPLLQAGLAVDGCDISADMLAHCRRKVAQAGFRPSLYRQAMHELLLPNNYKTIIICDSFGLSGSHELDLETLRRCYRHLEPGGALIFNKDLPYHSPAEWGYWLADKRESLPETWPEQGRRRAAPDGTQYEWLLRLVDLDPLEQTYVAEAKVNRWRENELLETETRSLRGCLYFKNHLVSLLQLAGFEEIRVEGAYSGAAPTPEDADLVYIARKVS